MSQFQVLFSGQINDGAAQDVVMQNLARSLSLDDRKIGQLFSGRTVVVKSQLSQDEAEALQEQFSDMGAVARVKDLQPANNPAFKTDERATDHTLRDITAAHQECPRCGHMQLDSQFCARCGVDIASKAKQSRKEDLLIAKKIRELQLKREEDARASRTAKTVLKATDELDPEEFAALSSEVQDSAEPENYGRISGWIKKFKKR